MKITRLEVDEVRFRLTEPYSIAYEHIESVSNVFLRIETDAKQGYTVDQTLDFVKRTKRGRLQLIEQPTPKGQPDLLGRITAAVPIPVMADESLASSRQRAVEDVERLYLKNQLEENHGETVVAGEKGTLSIEGVVQSGSLDSICPSHYICIATGSLLKRFVTPV